MADTSIEWTDKTWNPVRGCSRVSAGCQRCYAETMAARNLPEMRSPTTGKPFAVRTPAGPRWTGAVELIPSKLDEPLRWRKPQRIFVNSMSDLFHEALPDEAIDQVFAVMALAHWHTFQILTKRPEEMQQYLSDGDRPHAIRDAVWKWHEAQYPTSYRLSDGLPIHPLQIASDLSNRLESPRWPLPNVWLGVSVEDQATADLRIPLLLQTPAAVRIISLEPQLGPVDLARMQEYGMTYLDALDQVIQGGESGPGARPFEVAWARTTRDQCKAAGVAYFLKQLGRFPVGDVADAREWDSKGGDMTQWPEDLRVREFPA